jgi:uncharacterized protein (DUF111 family)
MTTALIVEEDRIMTKTIYFDCNSGVSSDMGLSALIDLGVNASEINEKLAEVLPEHYELVVSHVTKQGIGGVASRVIATSSFWAKSQNPHDAMDPATTLRSAQDDEHGHTTDTTVIPAKAGISPFAHGHTHYSEIKSLIQSADISDSAKDVALNIYRVVAEAESSVHETSLDDVAFHEVGRPQAVFTILAIALAYEILGSPKVSCGSVRDGQGVIETAHGVIPVPVPAVLAMAKNTKIPILIDSSVSTEMVTPSGYAVLIGLGAEYVKEFAIAPDAVGYGFGNRDTGRLPAVRAMFGEVG